MVALQRLADSGMDIPALRNTPRISADVVWIWQGFQSLSSKRLRFQGEPQAIQTSEMLAYLAREGVQNEAQRDMFFRCVDQLDLMVIRDYVDRKPTKKPGQGK